MTQVSFEDFYQVPDLKFDISKLRSDLEVILKSKNFNSLGINPQKRAEMLSIDDFVNIENYIYDHKIMIWEWYNFVLWI